MSLDELNAHIQSCMDAQMTAYADFQAFGNPADRATACEHLQRMTDAIKVRNALIVARGDAIEALEVDANMDYFSAAGAVDGQRSREACSGTH